MVRQTGDTNAKSPPLIIEPAQMGKIVEVLAAALRDTA
jgi:beta-alanine--pyruvate transaminase